MTEQAPAATQHKAAAPPKRRVGLVAAPLIIFMIMAAVFALALKSGDPSKLPSALIGRPAPQIELPPLEGLVEAGRPVPGFSTGTLGGGQVAVVNFWASWCVPCVQEHPRLIEIATRTGVPVHGINYKDQTAGARRFLGRYGNPYTSVGVDANGRAAIEWGVYGMPETFVIDGAGVVVYKHVGPISEESLASRVLPAIEAAKANRPVPR